MTFFVFRVHFILAALCFVACARPSIVGLMMRLSRWTLGSIWAFFMLTGVSQVLELTGDASSLGATLVNIARIAALTGMLVFAYVDQQRIIRRVANAFAMIQEHFEGQAVVPGAKGREMVERGEAQRLNVGRVVAATMQHAFLAKDGEEPKDGALS